MTTTPSRRVSVSSARGLRGRRSEGPRALREPREAYSSFCLRAVIAVTALREALCLSTACERGRAAEEFPRCLITNDHMSCGSRFPLRWKRSFPILAVRPTLKLTAAPMRQAAIP
jgi:hypothetical protein